MSYFESSLDTKARRLRDLEVDTESESANAGSGSQRGYFAPSKPSLDFKRNSLTPKKAPSTPPPSIPLPSIRLPKIPFDNDTDSNDSEFTYSEATLSKDVAVTSEVSPSPKTTPISKKKGMAPRAPNVAAAKGAPTGAKTIALRDQSNDPSLDIETPRPNGGGSNYSTVERNVYHDDADSEFQFESLSRSPSERSIAFQRNLRFRKVTFKEFSQRGFLVPTWYVGVLQMTVGLATSILAIAEILFPTGSDTYYGVTSMAWFTIKEWNIYGLSVVSSMLLMIAGCYLVRAQAKNDLYVIRKSAGYAAFSTIFHIGTLMARLTFLWLGKISPSAIGVNMYIASLCIIILTIFGFWFSALGFGVYGLYVVNHVQEVDKPENLHRESGSVTDLLGTYRGITR